MKIKGMPRDKNNSPAFMEYMYFAGCSGVFTAVCHIEYCEDPENEVDRTSHLSTPTGAKLSINIIMKDEDNLI